MSNSAYAKPGDTIEDRSTTARKRRRMLVIKKPDSMAFSNADSDPGCAWFMSGGHAFFLRPKHYTVVERAGEVHRTADEVVELDVDASLKKQKDDNLRHAFGF